MVLRQALSQALDIFRPALDVSDVFFVSYVVCLELKSVHNPKKAFFSKHLDSRPYKDIVRHLEYMFGCSAKVLEIWALIRSIKLKCVTRIRDKSEIFDMSIIPARNIMIIKNGEEVTKNCRFFAHEPYDINRERTRYPQSPLSEQDAWTMPFTSVANKPALA